MDWVSGKLVGLDLETTSTDIEDARIVTAALVTLAGGEVVDVWSSLPIPDRDPGRRHRDARDHDRGGAGARAAG